MEDSCGPPATETGGPGTDRVVVQPVSSETVNYR
jgi:hypothetical protein